MIPYTSPFLAIAWVLAIDLAALAIGRAILRRFAPDRSAGLAEALALPIVVGQSVMTMGVFLLGVLHVLHAPLLVALVVLGAWPGWRALRAELGAERAPVPSMRRDPAAWMLFFLLAGHALVSLGPALQHDTVVYHVNLPFTYLRHHALFAWPENLVANMPHAFDLYFTLGYAGGGLAAVNLVAFQSVVLTVAALRAALTRAGRPELAGAAGLLLLASPMVCQFLTGAYIEKLSGCWVVCAFLLLGRFAAAPTRGSFLLFAALVGWILGTKYTSWVWAGGLGASAAWILVARVPGWRERARLAVWGALVAALLYAPWAIRALLVTGNPVFPMMYTQLGGTGWSAIQQAQFDDLGRMPVPELAPVLDHVRLFLPLDIVLNPERRSAAGLSYVVALLACLVPLALFRARAIQGPWQADPVRRDMAWAAACGVLVAFVAYAQTPLVQHARYLSALVPWLVLAIALAFAPLVRSARALLVARGLSIAACALQTTWPWPHWEELTREGWVRTVQSFPTVPLIERMNRELPPDARVLFAFESRTWPLERDHDMDVVYVAPVSLRFIEEARDAREAMELLRARGYTHVSLNWHLMDRVFTDERWYRCSHPTLYPPERMQREKDLLNEALDVHARLLFKMGTHRVYALDAP